MYAANEARVLNASVEFDQKTLQPTYRLIVVSPGASSVWKSARRFGLPNDVIARQRPGEDSRTGHRVPAANQEGG